MWLTVKYLQDRHKSIFQIIFSKSQRKLQKAYVDFLKA